MTYFDEKQIKIINSWHSLSEKADDNYMAFMAEWIAFNAICYNLYSEKAVKKRANIESTRNQLNTITENLVHTKILSATETKIRSHNDKWKININFPDSKLSLSISEIYTEDIIFNEFVLDNENWYNENHILSNNLFESLKDSLKKDKRNFVINMAKSSWYSETLDIDEMSERNIVILCEDNNLKTVKNVLYQIRCNIFHGEKTPGDLNDDRIVKSSLPLLRFLVTRLFEIHKLNKESNQF